MAHKKNEQKQKSQKRAAVHTQQVDSTFVTQELARYHEIAQALHGCKYEEIEGILAPVTSLEEGTQLALLKALSKEQTLAAADVVLALNNFAPLKEVRKEARRSLLRLQEARIFPQWAPPTPPSADADLLTQAIEGLSTGPRRFWKAAYTNSRDIGEIHLVLFWEQGNHFRDVRSMNFLLEFWHDGVKDFFTQVINKRQAERLIEDLHLSSSGKGVIECTLPQARQLIEEALEVNKNFGTKPHSDYTRSLPLIRELIWDAPEAQGDQNTKAVAASQPATPSTSDLQDLLASFEKILGKMTSEGEDMVSEFIGGWSEGDFDTAYDLLDVTSPLRENLSREQWKARRERWYQEANVYDPRVYIIRERDKASEDTRRDHAVVDAFWSLEYRDTPQGLAPIELPVATAFYKETGRHWFWTSYTLIREREVDTSEREDEGLLVIETMTDEGANALSLPPTELRGRIAEIERIVGQRLEEEEERNPDGEMENVVESDKESLGKEDEEGLDEEKKMDATERYSDTYKLTVEAMCYNDGLIAQESPDNRDIEVYEQACRQAISTMDQQRSAVYLELIADRFPEKRVEAKEALAELYEDILDEYDDMDIEDIEDIEDEESDAKEVQRYKKLLEQAYRDAISAGGGASSYIRLAELLFDQDRVSDEVEDLLHQAQALTNDTEELASIERGLGNITLQRNDNEQTLKHFQRSAELDPESKGIWGLIGRVQSRLARYDEAIVSLQRAIEDDPSDSSNYLGLATVYSKQNDLANARKILKKGLEELPYSSGLAAMLSSLYSATGDLANAKKYLELAEEGDDEDEFDENLLAMARRAYEAKKAEKPSLLGKFNPPKKKKK